jgi:hypothetical protein
MSRELRGRLGGLALHSRHDSKEHLAPARRGFLARFELEVDPDGVLPIEERLKRAERARKAYMLRLAVKSADARRKAS